MSLFGKKLQVFLHHSVPFNHTRHARDLVKAANGRVSSILSKSITLIVSEEWDARFEKHPAPVVTIVFLQEHLVHWKVDSHIPAHLLVFPPSFQEAVDRSLRHALHSIASLQLMLNTSAPARSSGLDRSPPSAAAAPAAPTALSDAEWDGELNLDGLFRSGDGGWPGGDPGSLWESGSSQAEAVAAGADELRDDAMRDSLVTGWFDSPYASSSPGSSDVGSTAKCSSRYKSPFTSSYSSSFSAGLRNPSFSTASSFSSTSYSSHKPNPSTSASASASASASYASASAPAAPAPSSRIVSQRARFEEAARKRREQRKELNEWLQIDHSALEKATAALLASDCSNQSVVQNDVASDSLSSCEENELAFLEDIEGDGESESDEDEPVEEPIGAVGELGIAYTQEDEEEDMVKLFLLKDEVTAAHDEVGDALCRWRREAAEDARARALQAKEQAAADRVRRRAEKKRQVREARLRDVQQARAAAKRAREEKIAREEREAKRAELEKAHKKAEEKERRKREAEQWKQEQKEKKKEKAAKRAAYIRDRDRILKEDAEERGRKLFVGKLRFDDLKERMDALQYRQCVEKRKELIRTMLRSLGTVHALKENWDAGFLFVVFDSSLTANAAFEKLSDHAQRVLLCSELQEKLAVAGYSKLAAPLPNFYVRWPRNHASRS